MLPLDGDSHHHQSEATNISIDVCLFCPCHVLVHLVLIKPPREVLVLFHSTNEETEGHSSNTAFPRLHALKVPQQGVESQQTGVQVRCINQCTLPKSQPPLIPSIC